MTRRDEDGFARGRRQVIKAGALLVPTIATLHAMPAWAQNPYELTAYRYGTHAGLCRNPNFNPHASSQSTTGQEFIPCPEVGGDESSTDQTAGPGPSDF